MHITKVFYFFARISFKKKQHVLNTIIMRLKYISIFFILCFFISYQSLALSLTDSLDWNVSVKYLKTYCKKKTNDLQDKNLQKQLVDFIHIVEDKNIDKNIKITQQYLQQLKVNELITRLMQIADSLQIQKNKYNIYRETKSMSGDSLINYYDTAGISSSDSNFAYLLNSVFGNNTKDTTKSTQTKADTTWQTTYISDTLILSIRQVAQHLQTNSAFKWIGKQQNDTLQLYITNVNNDSIPIKLYENSNQLISLNITDFWGSEVSAIIRDINSNSFKLLIDNSPQIDNKAGEKAKRILKNQYSINHTDFNMLLDKRVAPNLLSPWSFYGNMGLDATQILLHQWNKGGESSIAFLANVDLYLKYKKNKHSLDSYAKFKLGLIRQGDYSDNKQHFKTNNDIIDLQAKYGYQVLGKKMAATLFGNFKTQFAPSYSYPSDTVKTLVSKFFSPAQITFAIGIDYKPKQNASVFFSPLTAKTTAVLDSEIDETKYGLAKNKKYRHEIGAIFKGYWKNKIWGDIVMENTLELFSNYIKNPQNVDISWDFKLIFPINDYIRSTISTGFIYDDDEKISKKRNDNTAYNSKGGQFKEMLMIGFYTFF